MWLLNMAGEVFVGLLVLTVLMYSMHAMLSRDQNESL